jgi:hypothetical protein
LQHQLAAAADLLGWFLGAEVFDQRRQQPLRPHCVGGAVVADRIEAGLDQLRDLRFEQVAVRARLLERETDGT